MAHPSLLDVQDQLLADLNIQLTPIAPEASICLSYLERICNTLKILTPDEAAERGVERNTALLDFQDAQAKFKAWGISIAAFRSELHPTSLGFRLRDAPDIRKRLCQVLKELREYLNDSSQIVSGKRFNEPWGEDITSDSDSDEEYQNKWQKAGKAVRPGGLEPTSELQELSTAINAAISNLMKLSMLIRESSKRDDYAKAASRYNTWSPSADIGHVEEKHGPAKGGSGNVWLLERLGKAITRRRQFLTYRKEHHDKLTGDWGEDIDVIEETPYTTQKGKNPAKTIAPTQATTFIQNMELPDETGSEFGGSFGSQTSYEATELASKDGPTKLTVPHPPKWAFEDVLFEYGEPFQCPICYTEQVVKNKNGWKKHVFRDLKPYVCTFQGCAMRMFRSRNQWFAHELQCHRREWVCQFCQHDAFPTAEMFTKHIISTHPAALAHSKIEAMILQSEEPLTRIPPDACPLCNEWEAVLRDLKQDSKRLLLNDGNIVEPYGTIKQFRRHLGRHLEQLALFALPLEESDGLDDQGPGEQEEDDTDLGDEEDSLKCEPEDIELFLPSEEQCLALTDEQCHRIQAELDPQNVRAYKIWEVKHQPHLIRLYMTGKSFPLIADAMKLDWSYKTYANRYRDWLFPVNQIERQQRIKELYALVSASNDPALPHVSTPPQFPQRRPPKRHLQPVPPPMPHDFLFPPSDLQEIQQVQAVKQPTLEEFEDYTSRAPNERAAEREFEFHHGVEEQLKARQEESGEGGELGRQQANVTSLTKKAEDVLKKAVNDDGLHELAAEKG